jgi:hypothetical protein
MLRLVLLATLALAACAQQPPYDWRQTRRDATESTAAEKCPPVADDARGRLITAARAKALAAAENHSPYHDADGLVAKIVAFDHSVPGPNATAGAAKMSRDAALISAFNGIKECGFWQALADKPSSFAADDAQADHLCRRQAYFVSMAFSHGPYGFLDGPSEGSSEYRVCMGAYNQTGVTPTGIPGD